MAVREKEKRPISIRPFPSVTEAREAHLSNALVAMRVTLLERTIEVREEP
jgi:hypothetical protein